MVPIHLLDISELKRNIVDGISISPSYQKYVKVGEFHDAIILCEYIEDKPIFLFEAYLDKDLYEYILYPLKSLVSGTDTTRDKIRISWCDIINN